MNTAELNASIDRALADRKSFTMDVPRGSGYGDCTLRYTATPHANPSIYETVYSVSALESATGGRVWDYSVNKNFDSRAQFVASLLARIRESATQGKAGTR